MHPSDSLFSGVKRVDYRNARYEGLFHATSSRRHGFGILLDDDMNLYCSEWENGRLSGSTFIALSSGYFFYGVWKNNEPNGLNVYRSRQFIVLGCYLRGQNVGNTIAITETLSHLLVFQGVEISYRDRKEGIQLLNHEAITQISLFQEIVLSSAAKFGLRLDKSELSPVSYLQKLAEKYSHLSIRFIEEGDCKFFGFQNGLGFRFNLQGKVYHKIKILSMGSFEDQRITDFGVKFHMNRCIQEGNFSLKQTITYNKWIERPRQKCLAISQKTHKKGLHFLNEYFQFKGHIIADLQSSLQARLWPRLQQIIKCEFQFRRQQKEKPTFTKESQSRSNNNREKLKKTLSRSLLQKNSSMMIKQSQIKNSPDRNQRIVKHRKLNELQKYQEIEKEIQDFRRPIACDRCWSKQRKRSALKKGAQSKSKQKKELSKSPSKMRKAKQIKYLADYHRKIPNSEEVIELDYKNHTKSFTNLLKKSEDKDKDKDFIRVVNERKIRQEILSRQRDLQIRRGAAISEYPRNFNEFVGIFPSQIQDYAPFDSNSIHKIESAYEPLISKMAQYSIQRRESKDVRQNDENLCSRGYDDYEQKLESKRDRILRQFKALNNINPNEGLLHTKNKSPKKGPSLTSYDHRQIQNQVSKARGAKQQIENFNKKYRNLLNNQSGSNDRQNLRRQFTKQRQSPMISSFGYSPSRFQKDKNQQRQLESGFKGYLDGNKKRYQYFFDVGEQNQV